MTFSRKDVLFSLHLFVASKKDWNIFFCMYQQLEEQALLRLNHEMCVLQDSNHLTTYLLQYTACMIVVRLWLLSTNDYNNNFDSSSNNNIITTANFIFMERRRDFFLVGNGDINLLTTHTHTHVAYMQNWDYHCILYRKKRP